YRIAKDDHSKVSGRGQRLPSPQVWPSSLVWRLVLIVHFRRRRKVAGSERNVGRRSCAVAVAVAAELQRHLRLVFRLAVVVGANDALHQVMTDNVAFVEVAELESFDIPEQVNR